MTESEFQAGLCARKKGRYSTKAEARKAARAIATRCGGRPMQLYICPHCGHYHLTSSREPTRGVIATGSILDARRALERDRA